MKTKQLIGVTISKPSIDYIIMIAKRLGISKSAAVDLLMFTNECELSLDTIEQYYTTIYQRADGRSKKVRV